MMIRLLLLLARGPKSGMVTPGSRREMSERLVTPAFDRVGPLTAEMLYGTSNTFCSRRLAVTTTSSRVSPGSAAACTCDAVPRATAMAVARRVCECQPGELWRAALWREALRG